MAWLCPFIYLQATLGSILNGLNKQLIVFRNNVIGLTIRITFIFLLIPLYGLKGYLWGFFLCSYMIVSLLNIIHLIRITSISFQIGDWIIKPIIVCLGSISAIQLFNYYVTMPFSVLLTTLINMGIFILLIVPLLLLTGSIQLSEIMFVFKGKKNDHINS